MSTSSTDFLEEAPLLQELELRQCGLQQIDPDICSLAQLQRLDVSSNSITEVIACRAGLQALSSLKHFYAVYESKQFQRKDGALIQKCPNHCSCACSLSCVWTWTDLRVIIEHELVKALSNCLQVPEQVTRLTALTELNIGNNTVARLPPQLGLMHPTLKRLLFEGNPIRTIRQAILQKGTPAVLEYLRDRIPAS